MSTAEPAMWVNPSAAATIAITKNVAAQFNIEQSFLNISQIFIRLAAGVNSFVHVKVY
jgi:hypothetical protein